ncbi:MAG: lysophospholipid acyltransferase family protein [Candidatus Omnitrophica bacterium]|nr:lysophospholipid acyltransferase family protein [Candidatus Omnitrophota bacterium]
MKQFFRSLGRYTLIAVRFLIAHMPQWLYRALSRVFMLIGYCVMINKRKLAIESLTGAFKTEKSDEEIFAIAKHCFKNFGEGMVELLFYADRISKIKEKISFSGKAHLDQALEQGNGAVLISAHFGNFILMYLRLVLEGYKTNVIMRRVRDKEFEKYISQFRDEKGIQTIYDLPPKQCVQKSIKALRRNEVLVILLDQNYGGAGRIFVDFFGRKAATAAGPVVFSSRTQAPVLPIFIRRLDQDKHIIEIEQALALMKAEDPQEELVKNVQMITEVIEKKIRQYPHEWGGWMHKRWKSRTIEEQTYLDALNH